ncbi:MAG TPA: SAM-dependent methyltransferase [Steroidobacteraceae bacterium]|jgi:SAM-dependent MidA family methyltransferase|nr:SAM-dependent methyltransferase [Steroidobacteraceae bacterium]
MMPALSPEEEAHSRAVTALIGERIRVSGGWIPFEDFMELALYAPGLGYYSAGSVKLGPGGDFVTAPEVSDLFSRCVARQCAQVLGAMSGAGHILELGAGTGRMAAVILQSLAAGGRLPERYAILEVSADLAERQRERLDRLPRELRERVVWLERLPARPIQGVVLANEVLDALPCRRFTVAGGGVRELGVGLEAGLPVQNGAVAAPEKPVDRDAAPDGTLASVCAALLRDLPAPLPEGYSSEICLRIAPWVAGVADCLERGVMLLFDYGLPRAHFYHPQRTTGTLRCHFKQRVHDDPYINVGVQDITAWVDFTRVAEAAVDCGLEVAGFCTQAGFLLATGVERLVAEATDPVAHVRLAGEARRLLLPAEMGEAFKVMALTRDHGEALQGFTLQDLRQSL